MKMKLVHAPLVMAVISALVNVASPKPTTSLTTPGPHGLNLNGKKFTLSRYSGAPNTTTKRPYTTTTTAPSTRGPHGLNLNGKMFTLSRYRGGISFFPPSWPSTPSYTTSPYYTNTPPYTTKRPLTTTKTPYPTTSKPPTTTHYPTTSKPPTTTHYPTTSKPPTTMHYPTTSKPPTTTHYPTTSKPPTTTHYAPNTTTKRPYTTTTAPSTRGVSVCLRYLTDYVQTSYPTIFTLSRSRNHLQLSGNGLGYTLTFNSYDTLSFTSSIRFWSNIGPDIWSRVCLTLDSMKNVAQVFSGSNISIRKLIPNQYVWSGEPVIEFTDFDGQVTDVQMWDYPLSYREVFNYMTSGVHGPYRGSVLTWSSISYSPRGDALLEDVYEWQAKQQISSRRGRPKGGKKTRKFGNVDEREEGKGNLL
ncbi:uncharacterized protein [Pagrus major]|uniref:uncharacterized protein n=1 Tax=Pagrus major TaxID=143350 RepID=UPI003CC8C6BD